ncbi:MAG: signal peptide peptidase SppA, partial [Desulfobacterales bacterium]
EIGYLNDALSKAKDLAGLSKDAKVVVYRRTKYPNDNLYNPTTYRYRSLDLSLIDLSLPEVLTSQGAGFYYIWPPAAGKGM